MRQPVYVIIISTRCNISSVNPTATLVGFFSQWLPDPQLDALRVRAYPKDFAERANTGCSHGADHQEDEQACYVRSVDNCEEAEDSTATRSGR
jgi:hypothetical protein